DIIGGKHQVDRDQHGADPRACKKGGSVFRRVHGKDSNTITAPDAMSDQKPCNPVRERIKFTIGEVPPHEVDRMALRPTRSTAPERVPNIETMDEIVINFRCHSFSSLAMISFIISDVPAPIVFKRRSRHMRPIGYSVV